MFDVCQDSNTTPKLSGQNYKIARFHCLIIPARVLNRKVRRLNAEISLKASDLIYWTWAVDKVSMRTGRHM